MSEETDALSVVTRLKELASDPLNRRAIVQDQGCLPGLILFLDHPNPQVVYSALLAVRHLAECCANRRELRRELGMMLSLQSIMHRETTTGEAKLLASEVYELLRSWTEETDEGEEEKDEEGRPSRRKAQFFLGSTNKRAKTIILHIDGLDDSSRRSLCEEVLLKIRGVISFTFQMAVKRCIIRIRSDLTAETLGSAIASTKVMRAQQVVKAANGDEVLIPIPPDTEEDVECVSVSVKLPEYLSEDDSPSAEGAGRSLSRVGSANENTGWLASAANFLSRSFYW
ncbi:armadillo repeat-containing protein 1-like [Chanos chanos]|uniref:Armadillo repeat-containing protein 1 n=1 Tax=Chanos chanos TaxID=29144 RepID=A0A6J2VC77_CHACN|nr:armadillo repeat-containing protein 1-like [Chanos chanos]